MALIACAAGSCVMITSVASARKPATIRRIAIAQYSVAAVIAVVSMVTFFAAGQQPEMAPAEYLNRNLGTAGTSLPWLLPLLYVLLALTLVAWVGLRHSSRSRRGSALFVFTVGIALIVLASAFFFLRAVGTTELVGVGAAATLLGCAMLIVPPGRCCPPSKTGSAPAANCGRFGRCSPNSAVGTPTSVSGYARAGRWCSGWPSGCR